jgi:hypothetical protein
MTIGIDLLAAARAEVLFTRDLPALSQPTYGGGRPEPSSAAAGATAAAAAASVRIATR